MPVLQKQPLKNNLKLVTTETKIFNWLLFSQTNASIVPMV